MAAPVILSTGLMAPMALSADTLALADRLGVEIRSDRIDWDGRDDASARMHILGAFLDRLQTEAYRAARADNGGRGYCAGSEQQYFAMLRATRQIRSVYIEQAEACGYSRAEIETAGGLLITY